MRRQSLKAPELYAVRGIDHRTVPALVMDTAAWDLLPGNPASFTLSPPDEQTPKVLNPATGARRGILTLLPTLDAPAETAEILVILRRAKRITRLAGLATNREAEPGGLRAMLTDQPLVLDVIRTTRIIKAWEEYASAPPLSCPDCQMPIETDASSRIRAHPNRKGVACIRNGTKIMPEERPDPSRTAREGS
ncbi:hypothetical protein ACFQ6C_25885 [Streptomyces sp. NPDC056454]|uniref:hypothetical protein n=1 Tax=Streptomyces sp. NPDC056454 TaxID=3345823 RepID=UPI0036A16A65